MVKIFFIGDEEHRAQKAEASAEDTTKIFGLAEQLSEAELEKMKKAVNIVDREWLQIGHNKSSKPCF